MWDHQLEQLNDFHCLAPDLPGHGHSRSIEWQSFERTADLVAEIIRREAVGGRAHIVGLSLGSYVGLTLLSRHQDVVHRAVLSGLNVLPLPNPRLLTLLGYVLAPLIKTSFGARMNMRALRIPASHADDYKQSLRQVSPRSFIAANRDAITFTAPANVGEIRTPTLLISGERKHPLIHRSMAVLQNTLPHAQQRWAPGTGHAWNGERPELFTATVRAWCEGRALPDELVVPQGSDKRN